MKILSKVILFLSVSFIITGCSESIMEFQNNDPEPEYRLFSLLDDFPALYDAFSGGLDQDRFNRLMADAVNPNTEASANVMRLTKDLVDMNIEDADHPVSSMITGLRDIIGRVLKQDRKNTEGDPLYYIKAMYGYPDNSEDFLQDFYSFMDRKRNAETDTADGMTAILRKTISYIRDNHTEDLEDVMSDIITTLKDTEGTNPAGLIEVFQETLAKLSVMANDDIWLDSSGSVIKDLTLVDTENNTNTGQGNAVRGIDALLSGVNDIISKDETGKKLLYDIFRETGKVMAVKDNDRGMKDVLRELICNIESNFTEGGSVYSTNPLMHQDNNSEYVESDLRISLKEAWPALQRIFIRAGKPGAIMTDRPTNPSADEIANGSFDKYKGSYLDYLTSALSRMNIDLTPLDMEQSLKRLLEYDVNGKLRSELESGSSGMSILEYAAVAMPVTNLFGYLDSGSGNDGGDNYDHGHGAKNYGSVTMTDSLFSQAGGATAGQTSYDLTMQPSHGLRVFRSSRPFSSEDKDDHRFYLHTNYPINGCMIGPSIGDGGTPNGGEGLVPKTKTISSWSDLDDLGLYDNNVTYYPKNLTGVGSFNTGTETGGIIVRTCWEGEGPYYATAGGKTETDEKGTVYTYFRPNGAVYCRVRKPESDNSSTWVYEYPADRENSPIDAIDLDDAGNPVLGPVTQTPQRSNRYMETFYSDYYIIKGRRKVGTKHEDCYCIPGDPQSHALTETVYAKRFEYHETVPENSASRECVTQEEALFRNYQWAMYEKKIVHVIPLVMEGLGLVLGTMFMRSESNGCVGLANSRKHPDDNANGIWRLGGTKEDTRNSETIPLNDENVDIPEMQGFPGKKYLKSRYPGDSRITIDFWGHEIAGQEMTADTAYAAIGKGGAMPDQIGVSFRPISRIAFPNDKKVMASQAGPDGPCWEERNRLLPVLIAAMGTLHERNYYESPADSNNHDYNGQALQDGKIKMPLLYMIDTVIPAFVKPLFYYQKSSDDTPDKCWKPRLFGNKDYLKPAAKVFQNELTYDGLDSIADKIARADLYEKVRGNYYEPMRPMASTNEGEIATSDAAPEVRTLVSYLIESEYRSMDGLLPFVVKTNLVKKLVLLLQHTGSDDGIYGDPEDFEINDYTTWGTRRKIMYGLEQVMTSVSSSKSTVHEKNYQLSFTHPDWLFSENTRDENVSLDKILDEIIGSDEDGDPGKGKGLAAVPDSRPDDADWDNFNNLIDGLGALMAEDGKYTTTEDIIRILDSNFSTCTPTDKELRALRHSLGAVIASYDRENSTWTYPDELKNIVSVYLPKILEIYSGKYNDFLTLGAGLSADNGFAEYMLDSFKSGYTTGEVLNQLYGFLDLDIIKNPESALWHDIGDIAEDVADMMYIEPEVQEEGEGTKSVNTYDQDELFPLMEQEEFDPYKRLGQMLSH